MRASEHDPQYCMTSEYRRCPQCRRSADRQEIATIVFCLLVTFTCIIPVIPMIIAIILQEW